MCKGRLGVFMAGVKEVFGRSGCVLGVTNGLGLAEMWTSVSPWCTVTGYAGADQLTAALQGCDLVIIPAGIPRKPGRGLHSLTSELNLSTFRNTSLT